MIYRFLLGPDILQKHFNRGMVIGRADCQSEGYRDEDYQGEGFESWCEQLIAAKELAIVGPGQAYPLFLQRQALNLDSHFFI